MFSLVRTFNYIIIIIIFLEFYIVLLFTGQPALNCPLYTITLHCITQTQEDVELIQLWKIAVPGNTPVTFTYTITNTSLLNVVMNLPVNVTSVLLRLSNITLSNNSVPLLIIESAVTLNLQTLEDVAVECSTNYEIANDSTVLSVDTSGKLC